MYRRGIYSSTCGIYTNTPTNPPHTHTFTPDKNIQTLNNCYPGEWQKSKSRRRKFYTFKISLYLEAQITFIIFKLYMKIISILYNLYNRCSYHIIFNN